MKKLFNLLSVCSAVMLAAGFMVSCGPQEEPPGPATIPVSSVSISQSSVSLEPGGTVSLTATVNPSDATDKTVIWSTSNQTVATVNNGTVTAVAEGTATITATAGGKSATCSVTVNKKVVAVTSIELDNAEVDIVSGSTITLKATVKPTDATDQKVTWESDNPEIATVDGSGKVNAIKEGVANITAKAGEKTVVCQVTVKPNEEDRIKTALMKIYDAMDGPNWKFHDGKWDISKGLESWHGVMRWDRATNTLELAFQGEFGLKGEFPDCFEDLSSCVSFLLTREEGVTGTLPPSFGKLNRLTQLTISNTAMTGLPDVFGDMPLKEVSIANNLSMTGPLPESLGNSDGLLEEKQTPNGDIYSNLIITNNAFTGTVPDSWARLGHVLSIYMEPNLSRQIPESFLTAEESGFLINMYLYNSRFDGPPFYVGNYDIPAYWPKRGLNDVLTGNPVSYKDIVSKNKVTVILSWATWCNFSKALLPLVIKMYDKYHNDGLEIIARQVNDPDYDRESVKKYIIEHGYDRWYNVTDFDLGLAEELSFSDGGTPSAKVVDNNGNIIFCGTSNVSDPSRNRFGHNAYDNLIPFLEGIFGPIEDEEVYSSKDYSRDGEVITLQKASVGKGINLVFMGDAYTDKDMGDGGLYETLMRQSMEEFFAIEPYKTFRNRFNVYAVKVVSKNGKSGNGYSTTLEVKVAASSISSGAIDKCYEYALKVPAIKDKKNLIIGVLANSVYVGGGITTMNESFQSAVGVLASGGNNPELFGPVLRHEVGGHAFAFLDDEYSKYQEEPSAEIIAYRKSMYEKYGWYANIDFTNDPSTVKWSAFLSDERYKGEVGIFEGGANYMMGVYRPSENSMMRDDLEYYNAPSRWAIYKRIMELSGETASFDKFLEYDAVNRGKN